MSLDAVRGREGVVAWVGMQPLLVVVPWQAYVADKVFFDEGERLAFEGVEPGRVSRECSQRAQSKRGGVQA